MFLAWREIKYSKTRFVLIIGVMVLVSYLVFFLTGLAYGLAQDNRLAIDKWDASGIILNSEANDNLSASTIEIKEITKLETKSTARLGQSATVIKKAGSSEKINSTIFGIDSTEFLKPSIVSGRMFEKNNEAVVDNSLIEKGIKLGDELELSISNTKVKVVGFTDNSKFNTAPVIYLNLSDWQLAKFQQSDLTDTGKISGLVMKNTPSSKLTLDSDKLSYLPIKKFIKAIPGYAAQTLTFGIMIGFLFVIAAFVIGIFIYVLTLQKRSMFGVMKAEGIPTSYISKSIIAQTFILASVGVAIGLVLTLITAAVLPPAVPYLTNVLFLSGFALVLIAVAILGAVFSVGTITKIDPLTAIGG